MTRIRSVIVACAIALATPGLTPSSQTPNELSVAISPVASISGVLTVQKLISRRGATYILDQQGHRLYVRNEATGRTAVYGGIGNGPGDLYYPFDIAVADDGTIAIKDLGNTRIMILDRSFHPIASVSDVPQTIGLALDRQANLYVGQPGAGHLISVFNKTGDRVRTFGPLMSENALLGSSQFAGRNQSALNRVRLAFDDEDNLWVSFIHAPLIMKYSRDGAELARTRLESSAVKLLAGDVLKDPATVDVASSDFDGVQLADVSRDIVFDPVHRTILVVHGDNRITVLDISGAVVRTIRPELPAGTVQTVAVLDDGRALGALFLSSKLFAFELR